MGAPLPNDADALLVAAPPAPAADGRAIFFLGSDEAGLAATLEDGLVLGAGADGAAAAGAGVSSDAGTAAGEAASSADIVGSEVTTDQVGLATRSSTVLLTGHWTYAKMLRFEGSGSGVLVLGAISTSASVSVCDVSKREVDIPI